MTDKPAFGFQNLGDFTPTPKPASAQPTKTDEIDEAASKLGFFARDTTNQRRKKRRVSKPVDQFNIRAHIDDINRFVEFAETNNLSYRQLFSELVKKL